MSTWSLRFLSLTFSGVLVCVAGAADEHADLLIARSAQMQLKLSPSGFVPSGTPEAVVHLEPAGGPLFFGWTGEDPGFDDLDTPDPGQDCYPLATGARIWLEIVTIDPALALWDVQFRRYDQPGQRAYLGAAPGIHTHVIWHVDSQYPNFEPLYGLKVHWRATFRIVDTGGTGYAASESFPMIFGITECTTGDVNGDGRVDFGDINPYIDVLLRPAEATVQQRCAADINLDGWVDFGDINPFVALLTNP